MKTSIIILSLLIVFSSQKRFLEENKKEIREMTSIKTIDDEDVPLRQMASRDESDDAGGVVYFDEEAVALRKTTSDDISNGGDLLVIDDGEVPLRKLDDLSDLVDISEEETPLRILVATPEGEVLRELA